MLIVDWRYLYTEFGYWYGYINHRYIAVSPSFLLILYESVLGVNSISCFTKVNYLSRVADTEGSYPVILWVLGASTVGTGASRVIGAQACSRPRLPQVQILEMSDTAFCFLAVARKWYQWFWFLGIRVLWSTMDFSKPQAIAGMWSPPCRLAILYLNGITTHRLVDLFDFFSFSSTSTSNPPITPSYGHLYDPLYGQYDSIGDGTN